MTTDKQIEANRRNAQKSTGPRTEEGKARSSRNAVKHGLTAEKVILPGEDLAYFESFRFGLFESLRPEGDYETQLVLRLAAQQWRLQRIPAIEVGLWARLADPTPELTAALSPWSRDSQNAETAGWVPDLAQSWMNDGDSAYGGALGRLTRYETALERSCTRITAELRRAQRHRMERLAEDQKGRLERIAEDQNDRVERLAEDQNDRVERLAEESNGRQEMEAEEMARGGMEREVEERPDASPGNRVGRPAPTTPGSPAGTDCESKPNGEDGLGGEAPRSHGENGVDQGNVQSP